MFTSNDLSNNANNKESIPLANLIFAGSLVVIILLFPGLFGRLDTWLHDIWLNLRLEINKPLSKLSMLKFLAPNKPVSDEILLVLIDDETILENPAIYNGDRTDLARAINKLQAFNPKLIALDVFLGTASSISEKGDKDLSQAIQKPNVVLKSFRRDKNHITLPYALFAYKGNCAQSYFEKYRGEAIRRVSLSYLNESSELNKSFLSEMWRIYNGLKPGEVRFNANFMMAKTKDGKYYRVPLTNHEYMMLNYDINVKFFKTINLKSLLNDEVKKKEIENKAIIIGESHSMLRDNYYTPQGTYVNSTYLNALALRNLINGNYLTQPDEVLSQVIPIVILAFFIFFVFNFLGPVTSFIFSCITIPVLIVASFISLTRYAYVLDVSSSIIAIATSLMFVIGRKYYLEVSEKLKIKNAFQHYVTASVVNEILKNPQKLHLHGELRNLTIFFSDIEGFTSMSEGMSSPLDVVAILNEYLTEMTDIIFKFDGLLDKYEGDAIMSIFGAPIDQTDHAIRSCLCAIESQKALRKLRERWKNENKPQLRARIGINTGEVVVGNMGSKMRFDYTVIGDNVNLAARLETANKIFGTEILISENTANLVGDKIITRCIAKLKVIGKSNLVNVYEVLADRDDEDKEFVNKALKAKEAYEASFNKLAQRQFSEAYSILERYIEENPNDMPANALFNKLKGYLIIPPPEGMETLVAQEVK